MSEIFAHTAANPFRVSVGAVVVNADGKILLHSVGRAETFPDVREAMESVGVDTLYYLMRESIEDGETLEGAVLRGIYEEFGATGEVVRYLGSVQGRAYSKQGPFEKTTLYFEVRLKELGERPEDDEGSSTLVWMTPEEALDCMKRHENMPMRDDFNEGKIIDAYVRYR